MEEEDELEIGDDQPFEVPWLGRLLIFGRHPPALTRRQWLVMVLLTACGLFKSYDETIVTLVLPQLQKDLGISDNGVSFLGAFLSLGGVLGMPLLVMADVYGRRSVLLCTILPYSVLTGLTALSRTWADFAALQLGARIFLAGEHLVSQVVIIEEMPSHCRGWAIGVLAAATAFGGGLGILLFGFVGDRANGWRWLYALAVVPLLFLANVRRRLPETSRFQAQARAEKCAAGRSDAASTTQQQRRRSAGVTFAAEAQVIGVPSLDDADGHDDVSAAASFDDKRGGRSYVAVNGLPSLDDADGHDDVSAAASFDDKRGSAASLAASLQSSPSAVASMTVGDVVVAMPSAATQGGGRSEAVSEFWQDDPPIAGAMSEFWQDVTAKNATSSQSSQLRVSSSSAREQIRTYEARQDEDRARHREAERSPLRDDDNEQERHCCKTPRSLRPLRRLFEESWPQAQAVLALVGLGAYANAAGDLYGFKYLQEAHGLAARDVSLLGILGGLLALGAFTLAGEVSDRLGRRKITAVCYILNGALGTLYFLTPSGRVSSWLVRLVWVLWVACGMALGTLVTALVVEVFPTSHRATAQSLAPMAVSVAAPLGILTEGLLARGLGSEENAGIGHWRATAMMASLTALCAPIVVLRFPETAGCNLEDICASKG